MTREADGPRVYVVMGDGSSYRHDALESMLNATGQMFEPATGQRFGHTSDQSLNRSSGTENGSALLSGRFPYDAHAEALRRGHVVPPYKPHEVHKEFPERWRRYIRSNFSDLVHVQQVFGVSERTARKWWKGETGANGGHVAIAMRENPVAANRILFSED